MNLAEIRQAVFDLADWAPVESTEAIARLDRFINRVLQKMVYKQPRLFERQVSVFTQPDTTSSADNALDRLTTVVDAGATYAWVMELQDTALKFEEDGSWEGRHLEFVGADGAWHSNVIREVWRHAGLSRISLMRPIEPVDPAGVEYRVWTPQLWLPPDVVKIKKISLHTSIGDQPVTFFDRERISVRNLSDLYALREGTETTGTPNTAYPGPLYMLPGPEEAVQIIYSDNVSWIGPDPAGEFEYRLTYRWGKRDLDVMTPLGFREPLFESAPNPASIKQTVTYGGLAPQLKLPAIDWSMDFYNALGGGLAYARDQKSGLRIAIWRRRYKSSKAGVATPIAASVYQTFGWCLLAEVDGHTRTYVDDGSTLVDRRRRLKTAQFYDSLTLYPRWNERAEVKLDAVVRPQPLEHDNDTVRLPPEGMDYLINRSAHLLFTSLNEKTWAQTALDMADEDAGDLAKNRGRQSNAKRRRRLSRGGRYR